ncbi:MAG: hypothetical protein QOJ98_2278 [Acidobacteriota bacterium]|jgi:hypothetical protein|nr:hypothetical protein [Acidobacteriota bacterium]
MSTHENPPQREWPPLERGRPVPGVKEWLDEHWGEYPGEWVAVRDGQLLAMPLRSTTSSGSLAVR